MVFLELRRDSRVTTGILAFPLGWPWDPLEKEMATHSSILAWRIPWTEEHGIFQARVLEWGAIAFSDSIGLEKTEIYDEMSSQSLIVTRVAWAL